jgi:putative transposase
LKGQASVRQICTILAISRSWYYAANDPAPSEADTLLRARIEEIVLEFSGYGYRRVTKTLQREGLDINHKRVLRIMQEESLLCQLKRRFVVTTDSRHEFGSYPNRIKGLVVTRLNHVWIADLTYVRLPRGFVYVAAVLDWLSRKVIGWAMSRWIDAALALKALDHALATRSVSAGLTHHSDHGVQYASAAYVSRLEENGIAISMAAIGNPYENARAESFFKTLKTEEVYVKDYVDADDAEKQIGHFLEAVYNEKRLHSSLDYRPPNEFERDLAITAGAR